MPSLPARIVCLQPSVTVILAGLGEAERIVACTKYCAEVCPEVRGRRAVVADSWTAKAGEILATRPDLVIASVPYQEKAVSEILKAGVRFLGFAPKTLDDIYADILIIAAVVGANEAGERMIAEMQERIAAVRRRTSHALRPKVFCEEWGKPIIASQAWVAELVETAGGQFLGQPGVRCSSEEVLMENPDILIAAWCGTGDRVPLEKLVRNRGWQNMKAVRDGRVYCVKDEFLNTPAPTLLEGLHALAAAIHPELFPRAFGLRRISADGGSPSKHHAGV
jgi:iron complex transport system substrate-binding protein